VTAAMPAVVSSSEATSAASPPASSPAPAPAGSTANATLGPRAELRCAGNRDLRFTLGSDVVVGRMGDVDVTAAPDSNFISRRHARLFVRDGRWHIEHLAKTNATTVGGQPVTETRPLVSGETVVLGKTAFVFRVLG
jgi:pSer/pThr/pTyr-binding forkhead associated (FHA) protein